jgi:subtilase family serine protease
MALKAAVNHAGTRTAGIASVLRRTGVDSSQSVLRLFAKDATVHAKLASSSLEAGIHFMFHSSFCFGSAGSFVLVIGSFLNPPAGGGAERQIVRPVNETQRVALTGNIRPEATPRNDLGAVDDDLPLDHVQLLLRRPDAVQQQLDAYTESLSDKSSANFHQWLTAGELGQRFGVAEQDIDAITGWLALHGFHVDQVYPNRIAIDFSGTAAQVREAFQTEIHNYEVNGVRHIANNTDPTVPAALAPTIAGIVSLHDFRPRPMFKPRRPQYTFDSGGEQNAVTPGDLAAIYNLKPLFSSGHSGKGQTIAVIEDTNLYSTADWTTFRKKFGLSTYTSGSLKQVHPAPKSGTSNCSDPGVNADGDDSEATIDAEYASAAAPNAEIEVASCNNTNTTFGGQIALQNLLNGASTPPALISISYGDCESDNGAAANAALSNLYQQAVAEGVSVFVSSGDEGAASCDANQPSATLGISISGYASTPYNVAVGGTDFEDTYLKESSTYWSGTNSSTYESARGYIPEIPWNDSCAGKLLASYESGSSVAYGEKGFCNTATGDGYMTVDSGSGGPSACAKGTASAKDVTSGSCQGWAKPKWQSLVGVPSDGVRDIPDVSLFAANGVWGHYYVYCFSDPDNGGSSCNQSPSNWASAGGTSFTAPILAGIQALVVQKWGRQGNPNPIYYKIANSEYGSKGKSSCNSSLGKDVASSCVFYDVTAGDMDVNCTGSHNCYRPSGENGVLSTSDSSDKPAFSAATGWDFATGIGTLNAYNLVFSKDW